MAAPKTDNKAIDDQQKSGAEFMVQVNVGLATFEALSHDPENIGKITGIMNGLGSWSTSQTDHNGNKTSITHGAEKAAAQAAHKDVSGGHSVERVAGGTHSQKGNGSNEENGESKTEAVNGTVQKASAASSKDMSKGGNAQSHHKGDITTSVEEGGKHFNVAKDFTVTATGELVSISSAKEVVINAKKKITLQVGTSSITIVPTGVEISTNGFINLYVNEGSSPISIFNYGGGNVQMGADNGQTTIGGKTVQVKSKSGTFIEVANTVSKGPKPTQGITEMPWGGLPPK